MKKKYLIPTLKTININSKDIITTSDFGGPEITDPEIGPLDDD